MARPRKTALSYFPFDVDFFQDERVVCIAGEFGLKGELVAVKLLCAVYSKGYYAEWNEMVKFKLLKDMPGIKASLLDDIVRRLVKWGFFDKTLFDSAQILTSVEIQETYFEAMKRCVKQDDLPYVIVPPPESASLTGVSATETTVNAANMPQIKEKEKKKTKAKQKRGSLRAQARRRRPPSEVLKLILFLLRPKNSWAMPCAARNCSPSVRPCKTPGHSRHIMMPADG